MVTVVVWISVIVVVMDTVKTVAILVVSVVVTVTGVGVDLIPLCIRRNSVRITSRNTLRRPTLRSLIRRSR